MLKVGFIKRIIREFDRMPGFVAMAIGIGIGTGIGIAIRLILWGD
jgi:hypothetical protein